MKPNKPDQSGNPTGRPKGSRSKVPEAFITAMNDDFAKHGVGIIEKVRTEKPAAQDRRLARSEGHQHHSSLRPTGALVRQDLAAGRDRTTDGRLLRATPKLEKPRRSSGLFAGQFSIIKFEHPLRLELPQMAEAELRRCRGLRLLMDESGHRLWHHIGMAALTGVARSTST